MLSFKFLFPVIIVILLTVVLFPLYIACVKRDFDLFEPILFKSIFMFMVVLELVNRVYLSSQFLAYEDQAHRSFSNAFILLGILYLFLYTSILIGYYIDISIFDELSGLFPKSGQYRTSLLKHISWIYLLAGAVSYAYLVGSAFDWNLLYMYSTATPRSQVFGSTRMTLLRMISKAMYVGFFLWITATVADGHSPKLRQLILFPPIVGAIALLGGRGLTIRVVLTFVVILFYIWVYEYVPVERNYLTFAKGRVNHASKLASVFSLGIGAALFIVLARSLRQAEGLSETITSIDVINLLTFGIQTDKFDSFILLLEYVPDQIGYYFGSLYLRAFTNFIPRVIWSSKPPLTVGSVLRRVALPTLNGGRPPGELGVYFANFGYLGIIICGIAYGMLLRLLYEGLIRNKRSPLAIVVFALVSVPLVVSGLTNNALWEIIVDLLWLSPAFLVHVDQFIDCTPSTQ